MARLLTVSAQSNISKAALLDQFGYEIAKERLYTHLGEETNTYATVRTLPAIGSKPEQRILLGDKLSADYRVLQNAELINAADPLLEQGCVMHGAGTFSEGRQVWIQLKMSSELIIGRSDRLEQLVLLSNDHTGKASAHIGLTPYRVSCKNSLRMAQYSKESTMTRIKHKGDIVWSVGNAVELLRSANAAFLGYGNMMETLVDAKANQADIDALVKQTFMPKFNESLAIGATTSDKEAHEKEQARLTKLQNVISEIFETEASITDHVDTAGTMYGAYQSLNYYLNHLKIGGDDKRQASMMFGRAASEDTRAINVALKLVSAR